MATSIHPDRQTDRQTINADGVETRLVNPRVIKQGGKTTATPKVALRALPTTFTESSHTSYSILLLLRSVALRAPSQLPPSSKRRLSVHFFVIQKCSESKAKKFPGDAKKFLVIEKKFPVIEKCSVRFCSQLLVKLFLAHTQSVTLSK